MRTSILSRQTWLGSVVLWCLGTPVLMLSAQSRTSQILILPDPTPREPDLEKRFNTSSAQADPGRLAAYNRQRFQLVEQASAHLQKIAVALQDSAAQNQVAARIVQEMRLAEAMETLAGNVYTAMAPAPSRPSEKTESGIPAASANSGEREELLAETKQLAALTGALQVEVGRSSAETLAVGVLIKSAQVKQLAHSLKERLQSEQKAAR